MRQFPKPQLLHQLLIDVGLTIPSGLPNPLIKHVSCDSRRVQDGSLFLGLSGSSFDGGTFWRQALSSGAAAAVIGPEAARVTNPKEEDTVVIVKEPVADWAGRLCSVFWGKPSSQIPLIGVTGTNGKTTTTYLIEYLSSVIGTPTALFGTLTNRWPLHSETAKHTTPFTDDLQAQLANSIKAGSKLAVMEVSSHALDQNRVAGCSFSGAVFTNLSHDHLDYHSSMENYFEAKSKLFKSPLLKEGKDRVIVNIDDIWGSQLAEQLGETCWRSSLLDESCKSSKAELTISNLEKTPHGVKGLLNSPFGQGSFVSPLIGKFNLMNLLQAVGVLLQQGFPLSDLLESVKGFKGVPGRMEEIKISSLSSNLKLPTVLIDYAHTPDGLRSALEACRYFAKGKLICVFGCGGDRDKEKRSKMGAIASKWSDLIVLTSDNPRTEDPSQISNDVLKGIAKEKLLALELDRGKAISRAISFADLDDFILIAGKGHEDYQIIGSKKVSFDDREESRKALLERFT